MLVTPASEMPQGTMLPNAPQACRVTLRAKPCMVVILATRMPMAQILRSPRPGAGASRGPRPVRPLDAPRVDAVGRQGQQVDDGLFEAADVYGADAEVSVTMG